MKRIKRRCKSKSIILLITSFVLTMLLFPGSAFAMRFELGSDALLDVDLTFTYGLSWRVTDPDKERLEDTEFDDGNHNFERYDLVNNKLTLITDVMLNFGDFGLFARGKALYDDVYMNKNAGGNPETNNYLLSKYPTSEGYTAEDRFEHKREWPDEVKKMNGKNAELLDLYAYASFRLAGLPMDLRIGRQVISWGESQLIANISGAQSPMDFSAAVQAGMEVKELYLPTQAAYLQVGLNENIGLNMYVQSEWEKNRQSQTGAFYSSADSVGETKVPIYYGEYNMLIPRGKEKDARDDGQWGVALTYLTPILNSMQIGFYRIHYHDKMPIVELASDYSKYDISYTEDIKLYGFSASTTIGEASVWFEAARRDDIRFQAATDTGVAIEMGNYQQANIGFILFTNPGFFSDMVLLMYEAAAAERFDFGSKEVKDEYAWQHSSKVGFDWYQVAPLFDMNFMVSFMEAPVGTIDTMTFIEGASTISTALSFTYDKVCKGALTFTDRFREHSQADRDTVSVSLSYSF